MIESIAFGAYRSEAQPGKRRFAKSKTSILRGEGRVAEWLKAPDSKSGLGETLTWVRIPPLPPIFTRESRMWLAFRGQFRDSFSDETEIRPCESEAH